MTAILDHLAIGTPALTPGWELDNPGWKEAFLHPRDAHGIVIQIAQQDRSYRSAPADLPAPGPSTRAVVVIAEDPHRIGRRIFRDHARPDRDRAR